MQVAELVLDYIQALIWPAVVVVGVFWLFRSQLGALLAERRVKTVKAAGVEVELEQVAEVLKGSQVELEQVAEILKESVEESRQEAAKAEDPEERERAAEKLQREEAALGRVETVQRGLSSSSSRVITAAADYWDRVLGEGIFADNRTASYLERVNSIVGGRKEELPHVTRYQIVEDATRRFRDDATKGIPAEQTITRLGPPEQFVDAWIDGWRHNR